MSPSTDGNAVSVATETDMTRLAGDTQPRGDEARVSRSRVVLRLLLIGVCLLAAGEGIARMWLTSPSGQQFDEELGWVWRPGALIMNAKEGGAHIRISADGLVDHDLQPKGDRYRILGFGNSFMEAIQVPIEANYTTLVEGLNDDVDFVNLARSGMGAPHYPFVLARWTQLEPDLLVVSVGQGDLTHLLGGTVSFERGVEGHIVDMSLGVAGKDKLKKVFGPLIERSALATYFMRRLKPVVLGWVDMFSGGGEEAPPEPAPATEAELERAVDRLAFVLQRMQSVAPTVLLDVPHVEYRAERQSGYAAPDEIEVYRRAAKRVGVPYVSAGPALIAQFADSGQPGHGFANLQVGAGHLNEAGHVAVASAFTEWLKAHRTGGAR